jgi:hypothetical protein
VDATVEIAEADFARIIMGKLTPQKAFMEGKMKVTHQHDEGLPMNVHILYYIWFFNKKLQCACLRLCTPGQRQYVEGDAAKSIFSKGETTVKTLI